jgi:hypothetical protein
MRKYGARVREGGQVLVLIIIVLALIGGGYWYLSLSRRNSEKEAWAFAQEVAERIAAQHDKRFLDLNLSPSAQVALPPSWRDQLFESIRDLGKPDGPIVVTGKVQFTSHFFEPKGVFRAQINYPGMLTYLDMSVSAPKGPWCIDALSLVSYPPRRD